MKVATQSSQYLHLLGYAYGGGGADPHTGEGPLVMQNSKLLIGSKIPYTWDIMLATSTTSNQTSNIDRVNDIRQLCRDLATHVAQLAKQQKAFAIIGGDHTCAIGTWSGISAACHDQGDIGLIWIDAHMDSHTPETTESGRIHGMPLATLLGAGYPELMNLLFPQEKLKPENVCLLGVRSFESGEANFLQQQKVRIFYMDEVKQRGFSAVMKDAIDHVTKATVNFGISLDLDSLDPVDAPAVAVPEVDGIRVQDLYDGLPQAFTHPKYITTEIVEFDPIRDIDHKTEKIVVTILEMMNHATDAENNKN